VPKNFQGVLLGSSKEGGGGEGGKFCNQKQECNEGLVGLGLLNFF
jgi:hypothetical protein